MNPSRLVNPSNPLRSGSRAVLSIHARNDYFPGGDRDKIRFLDNVNSSIALMDGEVPKIYSMMNPIYLRDDTVRRIDVDAFIEEDRDVDSSLMVKLVAKSNECKSVNGTLDGNIAGLVPVYGGNCNGAHGICKKKAGKVMNFGSKSIEMIPSCIEKLDGVKKLRLYGNDIAKIEMLENLEKLRELNLHTNNIVKIEGLDNLIHLKLLDLSFNQIGKIEGLDNLVNLEHLYLGNNKNIEKLEGLENLVNLKYISLNGNKIGSIEMLDNFERLKVLDVHDNDIDPAGCDAFRESHPGIEMWC